MSYRPDAQKAYEHLKVLAQGPNRRPYFAAVREYAHAEDDIAIPGLFGAFAVEIERRAGQGVDAKDQATVYEVVRAYIPDPSDEFSAAVGDTDLARFRLNVSDTRRINRNVSLAAGVVDRGRTTLAHKGLQILPVVSEVLKARGVDDPKRRAEMVGPIGFRLLVGLSISEERLDQFVGKMANLQEIAQQKGRTGIYLVEALFGGREEVARVFSDVIHAHETEGEVKRLRWEGSLPVKTGCPMALIQNTVFRPAWNQVTAYAFRNGFEV